MKTPYLFQTIVVLFWCVGIYHSDDFYEIFTFKDISKDAFCCFLLPDVLVIALLSLVNCYKNIDSLKYIILGAFLYSTFYCIAANLLLGGGEISVLLMVLGTFFNLFLCYSKKTFRSSKTKSVAFNYFKTLIQIICIWGLFLFVIPYFIVSVERNNYSYEPSYELQLIAIPLFIFFSIGGLWSSYILTKYGEGTPMPFDATNILVVKGPYNYIRNPMAFCGIGQGISIALYTSSISLFVFCILGIFSWDLVVRKFEEKDLIEKYGKEYLDYQKKIKCWIPNFKGYKRNE